jgi:hypothetical protein
LHLSWSIIMRFLIPTMMMMMVMNRTKRNEGVNCTVNQVKQQPRRTPKNPNRPKENPNPQAVANDANAMIGIIPLLQHNHMK